MLSVSSFNPVAPTTMMKVLSRISTLEAGKVKGSLAVDESYWYEFLGFLTLYFPIVLSRAGEGCASLTRQCWRSCVQEAQEMFAVPSTASSFPPSQVSG